MTASADRIDAERSRNAARNVPERLREFAAAFDIRLAEFLTPNGEVPARLLGATRYAALAPGKRVRPYLVVRCCELVGGNAVSAWPVAAAVECVHAFSLVHDDLPAMDDDELRRGRATCHVQFDEATAILAGDALIVIAFELLARGVADPVLSKRMVLELTVGSGWSGMIGGQMDDIVGETQPPSLDRTVAIHESKTVRLFMVACRLGAMVAGGESDALDALGRFGRQLGRAFQIADDLLDLTSTVESVGKRVGKDDAARKQTFPRAVGIEKSRATARDAVDAAVLELSVFGTDADDLRELVRYVVDRDF